MGKYEVLKLIFLTQSESFDGCFDPPHYSDTDLTFSDNILNNINEFVDE